MNLQLDISEFGLFAVVLLAVMVFALLRWLRRMVKRLPVSLTRRGQLERALPIAETLVGLVYLLSAVPLILDQQYSQIARGLILLGFGYVSWFAIRDFVSGAFLKSGQLVKVGDRVQLGELRGRLTRLGYRTLSVETAGGDEAIVPYSRVSNDSIIRTPAVDGIYRHAFVVAASPEVGDTAAGRAAIRRAALTHYWSSVVREPQIAVKDDGMFDVVVYALARDRGREIETAIRAALAS